MSNITAPPQPSILATGEGRHYHFLNHLATVKVAAAGSSALSAVEFVGPRGFGPPLHRHEREDELFIVLDGEMMFRTGDVEAVATAGTTAFLPRGRPHIFQVLSDTARFTCVTAAVDGAAPVFDEMVTELGVATAAPSLPEPTPVDPGRIAEVCRRLGIDILGPPPPPLD
jgi:quercetin dioxygenase-like cupin family protein